MPISYVLRVSSGGLRAGRLAGEVEHVASGRTSTFRDADELVAWCVRTGTGGGEALHLVLPEQVGATHEDVRAVGVDDPG